MKIIPPKFYAAFLIMIIPALGTIACTTTTAPFFYTNTFNVSSDHFREIREGPWDVIGYTNYRLFLDHEEKIIHVRGRGSYNKKDMEDNYDFHIEKISEEWFPGAEGIIKIHIGYYKRYEAVRGLLLDTASEFPDYAIRVGGYSLGAAWTQLFLLDAILHWPERDILAIFYAPANPWRSLPKKYQEDLKQHTIFVRSLWDPVTLMDAVGFHRYGYNITIGKWWRVLPSQHEPAQIIRALDEKFPEPPHGQD